MLLANANVIPDALMAGQSAGKYGHTYGRIKYDNFCTLSCLAGLLK
jgi:hypothetical protein